jgi:hypothetical protein
MEIEKAYVAGSGFFDAGVALEIRPREADEREIGRERRCFVSMATSQPVQASR